MRFTSLPDWYDLVQFYTRQISGGSRLSDTDMNFIADAAEVCVHLKASPIKSDQTMGTELVVMLAVFYAPMPDPEDKKVLLAEETRQTAFKIAVKLASSVIPDDHEVGCRFLREVNEYFKCLQNPMQQTV